MAAKEVTSTMVTPEDHVRPLELVELNSFARDADRIMQREELEKLREELSVLRQLGSVIPGSGGLRKFRHGAKGKGKRGGARIIYYYGGDHMPIFLISIYAKNEKDDMSVAEKKAAKKFVEMLNQEYRAKRQTPDLRIVQGTRRSR